MKTKLAFLMFLTIFVLSSCFNTKETIHNSIPNKEPTVKKLVNAQSENKKLTIETVKELSKKGDALTMQDFAKYKGSDIGSGLYVMKYPINEDYHLLVGGGALICPP